MKNRNFLLVYFCYIVLLIVGCFNINGQTTSIIVNNISTANSRRPDYNINGIPKSADIGGVDITATKVSGQRATLSGGYAFNDPISYVKTINLKNYNSSPVTVILKVNFKTTVGMKPYPRFNDEEERIFNIVLGGSNSIDAQKSIECSVGNIFDCEILNADMIVRKLQ